MTDKIPGYSSGNVTDGFAKPVRLKAVERQAGAGVSFFYTSHHITNAWRQPYRRIVPALLCGNAAGDAPAIPNAGALLNDATRERGNSIKCVSFFYTG